MKILHVANSLDPATGGPPIVATRLAAAQAKLGHEVHLAANHAAHAEAEIQRMLDGVPDAERLTIHSITETNALDRVLARNARRIFDQMMPEFDVAQLHGVWYPIVPAAANAAFANRLCCVVTPHGMLDPWSLRQKRLKKRIALALLYKRLLDNATYLHVLNRAEKQGIEPLNIHAPCEIIPNGVFRSEIDPLPSPGRFRAAHPELGDDPYILFLSRLHYKKGLDFLAKAFELVSGEYPHVRLVVAGPDDGAQAAFEQDIANAGLADRTHAVGPLYGEEKFAALVDAACFCLPSRQEGFSMAITEALGCSTPVVVTEACHFPEVAEVGAGEVVDLDARSVADGLLHILSDQSLRENMGQAGRELVLSRFSWPKIAERTIELYDKFAVK